MASTQYSPSDQLANVLIVTSLQNTKHVRVLGEISIFQMRQLELLMSQLKRDRHIKDYLLTGGEPATFEAAITWASRFNPPCQYTNDEMGLVSSEGVA